MYRNHEPAFVAAMLRASNDKRAIHMVPLAAERDRVFDRRAQPQAALPSPRAKEKVT
ncbi:MAG TPA: hypothetical protein VHD56_09020 [Tepidisphaeraceae bacterium]|nr:hypothetical protein [Tepidisphaeraceae bacterium]